MWIWNQYHTACYLPSRRISFDHLFSKFLTELVYAKELSSILIVEHLTSRLQVQHKTTIETQTVGMSVRFSWRHHLVDAASLFRLIRNSGLPYTRRPPMQRENIGDASAVSQTDCYWSHEATGRCNTPALQYWISTRLSLPSPVLPLHPADTLCIVHHTSHCHIHRWHPFNENNFFVCVIFLISKLLIIMV